MERDRVGQGESPVWGRGGSEPAPSSPGALGAQNASA